MIVGVGCDVVIGIVRRVWVDLGVERVVAASGERPGRYRGWGSAGRG